MVYIKPAVRGERSFVTATKVKALISHLDHLEELDPLRLDGAIFDAVAVPALALPAPSDSELALTKALESELEKVAESLMPKTIHVKIAQHGNQKLLVSQLRALSHLRARGYTNIGAPLLAAKTQQELQDFYDAAEKVGLTTGAGLLLNDLASIVLADEHAESIQAACFDLDALSKEHSAAVEKAARALSARLKDHKAQLLACGRACARIEVLDHLISIGVRGIAVPPFLARETALLAARAETKAQLKFIAESRFRRF